MRYNPAIHHRQSIRLRGYDYPQAGAYFVTICTYGRETVFGNIIADVMHPNAFGTIVAEDWVWLAEQFTYIDLDAFIVMPNHLHAIMVISESAGDMRMGAGTMQAGEGRQIGEGDSSITLREDLCRLGASLARSRRCRQNTSTNGGRHRVYDSGSAIIMNISSAMTMIYAVSVGTSSPTPRAGLTTANLSPHHRRGDARIALPDLPALPGLSPTTACRSPLPSRITASGSGRSRRTPGRRGRGWRCRCGRGRCSRRPPSPRRAWGRA